MLSGGRPSCFSNRSEKHQHGRDVEILLPVKFCWIPFSAFRGEVENVSANQRQGWPSCFPLGPKKKNSNVVEDVEILLPVNVRWNLFSRYRGEVENVSVRGQGGHLVFPIGPKSANIIEDFDRDLASCQVLLNSVQRFQRRSWKCLSQSEARAAILFSARPDKKFKRGRGRWDLASCQCSMKSVQSLQRRSRKCISQSESRAALLFSDRPEKLKLGRGRSIRSCFLTIFVVLCSAVTEEKSKMSQPIRGHCCHLVFPIGPKNTNFAGKGRWDLASCQVSLNSFQPFQRRSQKC